MVWTRIVDGISGRLAFFPPTPSSYLIEAHGDGHGHYARPVEPGVKKVPRAQVVTLNVPGSRTNEKIIAAYIPAPSKVRFTLLSSHGNAVDLGQVLPLYEQLAKLLKINVLAYDYRGYGKSSGVPAASATLVDISTVLKYVMDEYGRRPEDIVLYGQSIGTGPTSWLAAKTPDLAGVVLHAAFTSGLRVIKPNFNRWPAFADIFPNFKYVPKIKSRTLVMHVSSFFHYFWLRLMDRSGDFMLTWLAILYISNEVLLLYRARKTRSSMSLTGRNYMNYARTHQVKYIYI